MAEVGRGGAVDQRERVGWYVYDWANSAFSVTVVTVFLGPYLTAVTRAAADAAGYVYPLGIPIQAGAFFPFMVSLSVLLRVDVRQAAIEDGNQPPTGWCGERTSPLGISPDTGSSPSHTWRCEGQADAGECPVDDVPHVWYIKRLRLKL